MDEGEHVADCVTKQQKARLYRMLVQTGLTTAQIDEERTAIVRRLRAEGVSIRAVRQARMWEILAADHLGCDLDGEPLPDRVPIRSRSVPTDDSVPPASVPGWRFRISRAEASDELAAGSGRQSGYAERVEWVSQHLDTLSARPSTAPCNAAWSMLLWATENRKDFYSQQRQLMGRLEPDTDTTPETRRDMTRFQEQMQRLACWRQLEQRLDLDTVPIYWDEMPPHADAEIKTRAGCE